MRRPILVANWKMHKSVGASLAYGRELVRLLEDHGFDNTRELVLCPTLPALWGVGQRVLSAGVEVGAQNLDTGREGAVTGGVSAYLLAEAGATYVIVGHSERRMLFGETDEKVAAKAVAAFEGHLRPILCVGESSAERDAGRTDATVLRQLDAVLKALSRPEISLVVAYEPLWAIGTGRVAKPAEANRVAAVLRRHLVEVWGEEGREVRVLYGGSVNPENIAQFWGQQEIDGALVGGASLDVRGMVAMAEVPIE